LLATGHGDELAQLSLGKLDPDTLLADAIVAAWYSGLVATSNSGEGPVYEVADFTDALLWDALTFTKPWAECGGELGYWADPLDA